MSKGTISLSQRHNYLFLLKGTIILAQKHDYSCTKTWLFLLKCMIIIFKYTIILAQKHDYSYSKTRLFLLKNTIIHVKKHDYSCLKTRLFLLKNTIIISGCTKIKSGCMEYNAKTCTLGLSILFFRTQHLFAHYHCHLFFY